LWTEEQKLNIETQTTWRTGMVDFFTALFSILLKILIGLFAITLITGTFRRLFINKIITSLLALPDEKKERVIYVYQRVIQAWKILFWIIPIPVFLLGIAFSLSSLLPLATQKLIYQVFLTGTIAMAGLYIFALDDFCYKKKLLKFIVKTAEREKP
jgi:hypothetical protein